MITYPEALKIVLQHCAQLPSELIPLEKSYGRTLKEDLKADRDFPPFNRVTKDGIAIYFDSLKKGKRSFEIESLIKAGAAVSTLKDRSKCLEILVGSVLPENTDTVVGYDEVSIKDGLATITSNNIQQGQNIHKLGQDHQKNDLLVQKGVGIGPAEISIAASIGKDELKTAKTLKTIIISSGDELIPIDQEPKPHQIRRSNSFMLQSILVQENWEADITHIPDEKSTMKSMLEKVFREYDVLIFSGSVSRGKFDFLPNVLKEMGVHEHFNHVDQRPGKPFWFGTTSYNHYVFALPGNPVSSFICAYAYIIPWIRKSLGLDQKIRYVKLARDVKFEKQLTLFVQASLVIDEEGVTWAHPILSRGSGDFVNLTSGDGILILRGNQDIFKRGENFSCISYRK